MGLLIGVTGDNTAISPPFIVEQSQLGTIVSVISDALKETV